MGKLKINQLIVVEGKYDAASLQSIVDGLVICTGGFSIFTDEEKKNLVKSLAAKRGLIILTDSDSAGFKIRSWLAKVAQNCQVQHVYIPEIKGKEARKAAPSKEGTLGVEGVPQDILRSALAKFAQKQTGSPPQKSARQINYTDLYVWGLSGNAGSAEKRRGLLRSAGLPARLSKKALCAVLNSLYSFEEFEKLVLASE